MRCCLFTNCTFQSHLYHCNDIRQGIAVGVGGPQEHKEVVGGGVCQQEEVVGGVAVVAGYVEGHAPLQEDFTCLCVGERVFWEVILEVVFMCVLVRVVVCANTPLGVY